MNTYRHHLARETSELTSKVKHEKNQSQCLVPMPRRYWWRAKMRILFAPIRPLMVAGESQTLRVSAARRPRRRCVDPCHFAYQERSGCSASGYRFPSWWKPGHMCGSCVPSRRTRCTVAAYSFSKSQRCQWVAAAWSLRADLARPLASERQT